VHRELVSDPESELTKIGKVAILSGLTKAMTAFAVLQNVTHKRTMKHMNITILWKGLVVEEENSQVLIQFEQQYSTKSDYRPDSSLGTNSGQQHTDIIHELEEILANTSSDTGRDSVSDSNNSTSLISLSSASSNLNGKSIDLVLDENGNPYNLYEITTTTNRITTRTTRIRPIDTDGSKKLSAKQVVERTNEEDKESFIAVIDHHQVQDQYASNITTTDDTSSSNASYSNSITGSKFGKNETDLHNQLTVYDHTDTTLNKEAFQYNQTSANDSAWIHEKSTNGKNRAMGFKIMLSSVSKKLSRKKVERQTKYGLLTSQNGDTMEETIEGPITTMTSTSTTLQQQQSSTSQYRSRNDNDKPLPAAPNITMFSEDETENDPSFYSEPETKSKRRMSWSGIKIKNLGKKKKSVTSLFQKGLDAANNNGKKKKAPKSIAPPLPNNSNSPYLQKPNSINSLTSLSSIARTMKTTTFHATPTSPTNKTSTTTPSEPSTSRSLIRSPSVPARLHNNKQPISLLDSEPSPNNFPRKHIISNIAHFIRYASAAYGESFMRILGIGDIPSVLPNSHHPNHHAFAHHTGVGIEDILLSSYTDNHILSSVSNSKLHALVHYVTVDHYAEAIVLTCRGTLGLGDVLTDLTCDYKEFTLATNQLAQGEEANGGQPRHYVAHGGMLEAAQLLATQKGKVFDTIKRGLEDYPHYGLVLCGHSLGAGVASLLGVLWSEERLHFLSRHMMTNQQNNGKPRKFLDSFAAASVKRASCPFVTSEVSGLPAGRPIHCYTYGSPCAMSLPLSEYCGQGLVTSVVHAFDIVSSLSLGLLKDFKSIAVSLHEDSHVTDEILSRVIGHYQRKSAAMKEEKEEANNKEEENDQWFWALIKTMRADMRADKLYPPSSMYLIESVPQLVQHTESQSQSSRSNTRGTKHKRAHMVQFSRCEDVQARFSEIVFSRTMFMDHSPNMYEKAIKQLNKGFFGQY
jgi:hypothetical protein